MKISFVSILKISITLLIILVGESESQLRIMLKHDSNKNSFARFLVRAECDYEYTQFEKSNIRLKENGKPIAHFELYPQLICGTNVYRTWWWVDQGAEMGTGSPSAIEQAKEITYRFQQRASQPGPSIFVTSFYGFNDTINTLGYQLSPNESMSIVDTLTATGKSRIWDALYTLIPHYKAPIDIYFLISAGWDESRFHSEQEIIDLALANEIRIYTIGVGARRNDSLLMRIARATHGRYYVSPDSAQLENLYRTALRNSTSYGLYYPLVYPIPCSEDSIRTLEFSLFGSQLCPDSARASITYIAPPRSPQTVEVKVDEKTAFAGSSVAIPIRLFSSTANNFDPFNFIVSIDSNLARLDSIDLTRAFSRLDSTRISKIPGGYSVQIGNTQQLNINEAVVTLWITIFDRSKDTSTTIALRDWNFEYGCLFAHTREGVLTILKNLTNVDWDNEHRREFSLAQNYPNPFSESTTIEFKIADYGFQISDRPPLT